MAIKSLTAAVSGAAMALALAGPAIAAAAPAVPIVSPPTFVVAPAVDAWGRQRTDVIPDPAIHYGRLPNGMKYAIMHNATPKGAASVRLQFAFGSIGEAENERGLAHFIEHMAFNGTTHVPEGDMVKILERQGLAFGADTNAFTRFDTTTYVLELPQTDAQHVDTALFLFREIGSELKFEPAAVNRQRGVILSEERARDNFEEHQTEHLLGFEFPQTPYPARIPIGLDSVLKTASVADLRNLYHRYYRPENATLVFVGDADPAEIEAKILKAFSDWKGVGPAGAPLPRGKVDLARPASFSTFTDPAVATTVKYTVTRPWKHPDDTIAKRRHDLVLSLTTQMFDRRLQRLANAPGSSLIGGRMSSQEVRDAALGTSVVITAKNGAWKEALTDAEQEVRRPLRYGFTDSELKTASINLLGAMHTAMAGTDTRSNDELAQRILSTLEDHDFATAPRTMMPVLALLLKSISLDDVNAGFRELWSGSAPLVHVSSSQPVSERELAAAYDASRAVALAAPKENAAQAFAYDDMGKPGEVVEDKRIADLDVRTVRFANNVRLNIKKTDFEADRIHFLIRMGSGNLEMPRNEPGLAFMMSVTSAEAGLRKDSLDDLRDLFAGKVISPGARVEEDAFVATGTTVPKDLALQLKVSAAYLTDPGFRPEAANKWAAAVPILEKQVDAQPEAVASVRLPMLLANGDPRFGMPPEEVLAKRSFAEAKAALARIIPGAPIEITIVGDVDENAAIAAVASSFGALPTRRLVESVPADARRVSFRTDRTPILLKHDGPTNKAIVESIWPTTDDSDFPEVMRMEVLKNVLDLMLIESVRERLGDTYGAQVQINMSHNFKRFGFLSAAAVVAPDKADEVQKAIADAAAELRAKPVSDDVLARARNPLLESVDKALRNNGFWLNALSRAQSEPTLLERVRQRKPLLQSITPADLQKLAQKYLTPDRVQQVRIVSSKLATTTASN